MTELQKQDIPLALRGLTIQWKDSVNTTGKAVGSRGHWASSPALGSGGGASMQRLHRIYRWQTFRNRTGEERSVV